MIQNSLTAIAWLLACAWLWKMIGVMIGQPRVPDLTRPEYDRSPDGSPSITVIVPARNEEASVAACLESLFAQDYPNLRILAVNDRSTDATGAIMDALAVTHSERLAVLHIHELPAGWLGKTHAMSVAAERAIAEHRSDYLLFTDADVLFSPAILRISLAQAVATQADHFVTLPTPLIKSIGEGMLLGYLQIMGMWAVRFWRVEDPSAKRDAVGIGAFNLLRTTAYQKLGGFESLRMEILEDLTLARRVKLAGLRQRVAFAPNLVRLHWASGLFGVVNVMTKNLFAAFRFRILLLLGACVGFATLGIAPVLFLVPSATRIPALIALAAIALLYVPSYRSSRISPFYAVFFPASAALFLYSMLRSMVITLKDGGVTWRRTFYPLTELRKNVTSLR
jgi:cellulose synthase/poly-beta-1,6-N-acetylglucosamine synthase-like glycosyltransferase